MTDSLRMLGIARKAGALAIGEEAAGSAAREKKARLIISASDASENARRRVFGFSKLGNIPLLEPGYTKYELGEAVGKPQPAMIAVTDIGIAAGFVKKLNAEQADKFRELGELLDKKARRAMERRQKAGGPRTGKRRK